MLSRNLLKIQSLNLKLTLNANVVVSILRCLQLSNVQLFLKVIILDNVSWELRRVYVPKIVTYNDYEKLKEADFGRSRKRGSLKYNLKAREGIFGVFDHMFNHS